MYRYMANNMDEEHQEAREILFDHLYGSSRLQLPQFHRQRLRLLHSMHWWTMVSRDECEEVGAHGAEPFRRVGRMGNRGPRDTPHVSCVLRSRHSILTYGCGVRTAGT